VICEKCQAKLKAKRSITHNKLGEKRYECRCGAKYDKDGKYIGRESEIRGGK